MKGLKNQRVVITGGASGIGRATAERFHGEGARVIVLDHSVPGCRALAREHPDWLVVGCDVADEDDVVQAFARIDGVTSGLDILINNAGISIRRPFLDITVAEWQRVLGTNLNGVFHVAQQAARRMLAQRRGVILNMGSVNGIMGFPLYADYNASKAGVIELTRSMALELAPLVRVNVVCPGYILTPMQRAEYTDAMLAECVCKIPLGRLGEPSEIAALFAFLASDEAAFITGQTFVADGGEICGGLASR